MSDGQMTARERDDLQKLVRQRERVAKSQAKQRSAELLADVEEQLATRYKATNEAWRDITEKAKALVDEADAQIAQRCRELGIPEEFRPGLNLSWYGRGENADKERRAELRKVAQTRIEALEKRAVAAIEESSVNILTAIVAGGLETDVARSFLAAMPEPQALMPKLSVDELEKALPMGR